ncbi:MAG TPA: SurA N-terminal domain-containing protein [Spirochaetota bacterium]|nr:SurA N-terminal domain-containing protein [Spirochaetota bacterium]HOD13350.1 SurA N-terminal domain-containing protein [Spirochaetota bacterium]HPG51577.1 SurA N-terminal domain-containing protein [Spirochaetota bacterium]HPN13525.1 SurA N-terminal domain-containing protein [Spirochaetota bacterium]HQL80847.1 SurA N-terminal domain-containing protein [Spirochaetota bacterium]
MFDSKSPVVKIVSYTITGFFVLIIVISFGMPDFISRMGLDQSSVAVVNGEKVDRYDFLRYRDSRFGDMRGDEKMDAMILSYYINDVLLLQEARRNGFFVTDNAIKEYILNIPGLRNPATGTIDKERLDFFLERINMSFLTLQKTVRKELLRGRFMQFIKMGVAVTPAEVAGEFAANNAALQVKYSALSSMELANMYRAGIAVTDAEITAEMAKNKSEVKDPITDRERVKKKLENARLSRFKKDIIDRIDAIAAKGGSFDEAQAVLKGKVALSKTFKPGDRVTDDKGQAIAGINGSKIFLEGFMGLEENRTSRIINADSGLYIFTPVLKNIKRDAPSEKDYKMIADNLEQESMQMIQGNIMQKLYESAKIVKNLKTD